MIAPKYNNRKLNFIKRINNLYLFEDPKTKIKTTFTLQQLAEFNKKAKEILIKQNINNNIFYCEDRNKKIEKEQDKKIQKNKEPLGEKIYNYLIKNPSKTGKQICQDLNIGSIEKIPGIIRGHNSRRKNEYKQILHTKQKTGKSGNNINIYYVEV
jgi:hypothetical protein|nr:MAG TPA: hypothetical protein [Caudoviricetes sp.]